MTSPIDLINGALTGLASRLRLGGVRVLCTEIYDVLAELEQAFLQTQADDCERAPLRRPLAEGWHSVSG